MMQCVSMIHCWKAVLLISVPFRITVRTCWWNCVRDTLMMPACIHAWCDALFPAVDAVVQLIWVPCWMCHCCSAFVNLFTVGSTEHSDGVIASAGVACWRCCCCYCSCDASDPLGVVVLGVVIDDTERRCVVVVLIVLQVMIWWKTCDYYGGIAIRRMMLYGICFGVRKNRVWVFVVLTAELYLVLMEVWCHWHWQLLLQITGYSIVVEGTCSVVVVTIQSVLDTSNYWVLHYHSVIVVVVLLWWLPVFFIVVPLLIHCEMEEYDVCCCCCCEEHRWWRTLHCCWRRWREWKCYCLLELKIHWNGGVIRYLMLKEYLMKYHFLLLIHTRYLVGRHYILSMRYCDDDEGVDDDVWQWYYSDEGICYDTLLCSVFMKKWYIILICSACCAHCVRCWKWFGMTRYWYFVLYGYLTFECYSMMPLQWLIPALMCCCCYTCNVDSTVDTMVMCTLLFIPVLLIQYDGRSVPVVFTEDTVLETSMIC